MIRSFQKIFLYIQKNNLIKEEFIFINQIKF